MFLFFEEPKDVLPIAELLPRRLPFSGSIGLSRIQYRLLILVFKPPDQDVFENRIIGEPFGNDGKFVHDGL